MIYDRSTKSYYKEKQFGGALLRLLYTDVFKTVRPFFLRPGFSDYSAQMVERSYTAKKIERLMTEHGIDPDQFEGYPFNNFREFFLRRYKKDALPKVNDHEIISPSDGKVMVFSISDSLRVKVKGKNYSVKELMGGSESANLFAGGQLFLIRLSLHDCHRFLYTEDGPFSGKALRRLPGVLHTVSAYSGKEPVLKENERCYSILETVHGLAGVMEVGALMVGRIRYRRAEEARRYKERGWFEPGGSTILLFYQKGMVRPDRDIIRETFAGNEVKIRMGERIGQYVQSPSNLF